jgi:hypothetical protein
MRIRNVSDKRCRESQNTFCIQYFFERTLCEIMWKNVVKSDRPEMTIRRIRITCWITKATNVHLEYEILTAVPLLQLLYERASILRYMYTARLFFFLHIIA